MNDKSQQSDSKTTPGKSPNPQEKDNPRRQQTGKGGGGSSKSTDKQQSDTKQ